MKLRILRWAFTLLIAMLIQTPNLYGQNAFDALRFSRQLPGHDASTLSMPGLGVSTYNGVGSYLENPASLGLMNKSTFSLGAGLRRIEESTDFQQFNSNINENRAQLADVSLAFKIPTTQGSLVIGAGYNQVMDFNRAVSIDAFNTRSTITDMFNQSDFFGDTAFNAFAIDSVGNTTKSVLRMGEFRGIDQNAEIIQKGNLGEVAAFIATEFKKNLFIGASAGAIRGSYSFDQFFRESDTRNFFDGTQNTFDFNDMISNDQIEANIKGFSGRLGFLYRVSPFFNVGGSYRFRTNLSVEEEFSTRINTQFDNGDEFEDSFEGFNNYDVTIPGRFKLGMSLTELKGFSISGAVERVRFSQITMKNLGDERFRLAENEFIEEQFENVWNLNGAISYQLNSKAVIKTGYVYHPSNRKNFDNSKQFYSGGFSFKLSEGVTLDIGMHYATWNDETVLYQFFPDDSNNIVTEIANEDVSKINMVTGIRYTF